MTGRTYRALNASTGETLEPVYRDATAAEINAALESAAGAMAALAAITPSARASLLEGVAAELEAGGGPIVDRAGLETGLPRARLESELGRTTAQLRLFAALVREGSWVDARIDRALPDRKPARRPDLRRMLRPLGPVAVFGASNFPLAFSVAGGDTASALAAGNPVVVKAHPAHPGTSELSAGAVRRAVRAAGLPEGVFALLHGSAPEVSLALVRHPLLRAVAFTGSHVAGRALYDAAAARPEPIPVFAEMSGTNPVFLLPGALEERAETLAAGLAASFTLGVGQYCTKPGLVFGVVSPAWGRFAAKLAEHAAAVQPGVMLHAGVRRAFDQSLGRLTGVEWLARGGAHVARVAAATWRGTPVLQRECFGPFTLLITVDARAELAELARALEGQLTATVHGTESDFQDAAGLLGALESRAGRLVVNGWPTGVEVTHAMHHGGPYPATTDPRFTSVGTAAILRFARPVCYQDTPGLLLPAELRDSNPLGLHRLVDGVPTRDPIR